MSKCRYVFLLLVSFSFFAFGQGESKFKVSGGGGVALSLTSYWGLNYNINTGIEYSITKWFSLMGYFDYMKFSIDPKHFPSENIYLVDNAGADAIQKVASGLFATKFSLLIQNRPVLPYFAIGGGFAIITADSARLQQRLGNSYVVGGYSKGQAVFLLSVGIDMDIVKNLSGFLEFRRTGGISREFYSDITLLRAGIGLTL